MKQYNETKVDPKFDASNTTGTLCRKTKYQLSELHVMTISKKLQFGSKTAGSDIKNLVKFLDDYHETSVVPIDNE